MLYDEFNSHKNFSGADVFKNKALEKPEVLKNLNPAFSVREYQKEALGRFYYYCEEYHQKQKPIHLMFNMATGSGKTLIMAANLLYFYQKGYRNFIFFTRLGNIIQKTKANFLDPNSKKYLFADKITLGGQEIKIKEVDNFEGVNNDDINIIFSTTALLHSRFNFARENVLTYEDFDDKKIVLIADEAHNLSAETNNRHTQTEEEDRRNWENTVMRILNANSQKENALLEFTATARLEQEYPEILEKYKDKAIYRYDLKEYRLDGFSKDVRTLQINAPIMERVLSAVIISQYRRKVAEKYKIALKPVVMFKANRVSIPKERISREHNSQIVVSSIFKEAFHKLISELGEKHLKQQAVIKDVTLQKAFQFFNEQKITLADLVSEIKSDFAPEKCLTVDEDKDLEQKQILLNSLEDQNNEIRAIFATEKLNEGWDVLNLFDIVRLYDTRSEYKSKKGKERKPGKTTVQEAQLIGRGARYCPFTIGEFTDAYSRKFDNDQENELRILEQLYYHSMHNPDYISELTKVLVKDGIVPERTIKIEIKIKSDFKNSDFWKKGYIFLNSRKENLGKDVFALSDAKAEFDHNAEINIFQLPTREAIEKDLFVYQENSKKSGILEVNLVYDYRQAATNKLKSLGIVVKENRASYDSLKAKFLETKSEFEPEKENFDKAAEDFNERRKAYEKEVKYWNARGGAPEFEYQKLESEKMKLEAESSKLRDEEAKIKEMMDRINSMVVVLNRLADTLNLSVEKYNTVGASRGESFEEGVYYTDGSKREIDIYEFQSKTKLVRVLAHELGHALDLSHVDDPKAIMYKLNQGGNEALAGTDLEALRDKCGIKSL